MTLQIFICRRHIDVRSGAGQMIASQARFLTRKDFTVTVSCEKLGVGAGSAFAGCSLMHMPKISRLLLPARIRKQRYDVRVKHFRAGRRGIVIDHCETVADADISYVHNFLAPEHTVQATKYVTDQGGERDYWTAITAATTIIANSQMVKRGLVEKYGIPDTTIEVLYPGYDPVRYNPATREESRSAARQRLGVKDNEYLIGLITSGQFEKRGLDVFLDCIEKLRHQRPQIRALIVGGRHAPGSLQSHSLFKTGAVLYKPVTSVPEKYFSTLDAFLYPARYEEFGIVVLEAMAMGIPVISSGTVGAAELLAQSADQLIVPATESRTTDYCRRVAQLLDMRHEQLTDLSRSLQSIASEHTHDKHNALLEAIIETKLPAERIG